MGSTKHVLKDKSTKTTLRVNRQENGHESK